MKLRRMIAAGLLATVLCCSQLMTVYAAGLPQDEPMEPLPAADSTAPEEDPAEEPSAAPEEDPAEEPSAAPEEDPAEETPAAPEEDPAEGEDNQTETIYIDLSGIVLQSGGLGYPQQESAVGYSLAGAERLNQDVYKVLIDGMKARKTSIDISAYGVPNDQAVLSEMIAYVVDHAPELFYLDTSNIGIRLQNNKVTAVVPAYKSEYTPAHSQQLEAAVAEALKCINSQMTDLEKALALHDYLVQHIAYDRDLQNFNAYNALVERSCVCQGYALAYELLMQRVGIPCELVTSDKMNHAWNAIQLDGKWYHVDATWDDPVPDRIGNVMHDSFLRSDTGIAQNDHHGWTFAYSCTDSTYDLGWFWQNSNALIVYEGRTAYYICGDGNYSAQLRMRTSGGAETIIADSRQFGYWYSARGGTWDTAFTGLSSDGNTLFFNSSTRIYQWKIGSSSAPELLTTITHPEYVLYGAVCEGDTFVIAFGELDAPSYAATGEYEYGTAKLVREPEPEPAPNLTIDAAAGTISGARPETSVTAFLALLQEQYPEFAGEDATIRVYEGDTVLSGEQATVGTGCVVRATDAGGQVLKEQTVIIKGDVVGRTGSLVGNGEVSVDDVIEMRKHILHINILDGVFLQAAMVAPSSDGINVGVDDVIETRKFILRIVSTLG